MRSIDDYDDDANKAEEKQFRFTVNFKKIYSMGQDLLADNGVRNEKYPRNILIKMLGGIAFGWAVCFGFSYNILLIATLPFLFLYFMSFFSTKKAWKEYKYPMKEFWLISLGLFVASLGVAVVIQHFVFQTF